MRSSNDYSTAADEIHRAPYLAAADCASALLTFYLMVIPAVGELLAGIVTLKAGFRKGVPPGPGSSRAFSVFSQTGFFPLVMAPPLGRLRTPFARD